MTSKGDARTGAVRSQLPEKTRRHPRKSRSRVSFTNTGAGEYRVPAAGPEAARSAQTVPVSPGSVSGVGDSRPLAARRSWGTRSCDRDREFCRDRSFPGSTGRWIGSEEDEFPINRRLGFLINVVFGWELSIETVGGASAAARAALLYVSHLGNTSLHLSWAVRHRRYDPGCVTAVATLVPVAISGLRRLASDPAVARRSLRVGVAGGTALSAGLVPLMKWCAHRREAT